jgi:flagellar hook-associated protein 3 FlgL
MTISGLGNRSGQTIQSLLSMRSRLDDLQRQLGTGKKSSTYSGLGLDRSLAVGLRSQLTSIKAFGDSIKDVDVRLKLSQTALTQVDNSRIAVKNAVMKSVYTLDNTGQTADQKAAYQHLDLILGALNTQSGDRYLFSGSAVDKSAVESAGKIIDGDGIHAGLKQIIDERRQADLGASGLGRLTIGTPSGTETSLTEAAGPFGFKLANIATTLTGSTLTGPAGAPPAVSIDLGAVNPNAGETVSFVFDLPDGTSANLTLTATASATPGPNEFSIGAATTNTATNLQAALNTALGKLAGTTLTAASAVAAGNDFFNTDAANPPQRVQPPFNTSTALVNGTSADTVMWYTGEAGSTSARSTANAKVDPSISVSYGMRANEQALRLAVQNIAVFAATSYSASNPNDAASYDALKTRVASGLAGQQGQQKITDIESEIAGAQTTLKAAADRHTQTNTTLSDLLGQIEGAPTEEVASQILSLQTSMQASLQTTAMLLQTSILNYL